MSLAGKIFQRDFEIRGRSAVEGNWFNVFSHRHFVSVIEQDVTQGLAIGVSLSTWVSIYVFDAPASGPTSASWNRLQGKQAVGSLSIYA